MIDYVLRDNPVDHEIIRIIVMMSRKAKEKVEQTARQSAKEISDAA